MCGGIGRRMATTVLFLVIGTAVIFGTMQHHQGLLNPMVLVITISLTAVGVTYFMSRSLARSLEDLTLAAQKVAAGTPIRQINLPMGRPDEIGALAKAFHDMACRLEERQQRLIENELRAKAAGRSLCSELQTDLQLQRETNRLKDEFVATVSHELRTPLTSIKGALALLNSGTLGIIPEKAKSMLSIALNNSERLIRLINDILDIEKMEANKLTYDLKTIDLHAFIEQTIETNKHYADDTAVRLELDAQSRNLTVNADPDRLTQAMDNLISNAIKFSPSGGCVTIGVADNGGSARISVSDDGPGIPEEFQDQIFNKFAQADSSNTRKKGGTGLGLCITKAIIEDHGGRIAFETEKGEGTTFYFDLPLDDQDTATGDLSPKGRPAGGSRTPSSTETSRIG